MDLTPELVTEYQDTYAQIQITDQAFALNELAAITSGTPMPEFTGWGGIPWYFLAAIDYREDSLLLTGHLCNGDPLSARTVDDPAGRIVGIDPPYTLAQSVEDTIKENGWDAITTWDIATMLYQAEKFNGFGYRNGGHVSPYIWSYTSNYTGGKYIRDHVYDPTAKDGQIGAAVVIKLLTDGTLGTATIPDRE